jgi:hypothetical protein
MRTLATRIGNRRAPIVAHWYLGWFHFFAGKLAEARRYAQESYSMALEAHDALQVDPACVLAVLNSIELERHTEAMQLVESQQNNVWLGDWALAIIACAAAEYPTAKRYVIPVLQLIQTNRVDMALSGLAVSAAILAHEGQPQRAVETLALAMNQPTRLVGWMDKWPLLTRLRADLERDLGPEVFHTVYEQGGTLDIEPVIGQLIADFSQSP